MDAEEKIYVFICTNFYVEFSVSFHNECRQHSTVLLAVCVTGSIEIIDIFILP